MEKASDIPLKEQLIKMFYENKTLLVADESQEEINLREKSIQLFEQNGFPSTKHEDWRFTNLAEVINRSYAYNLIDTSKGIDISSIFKCDIYDLDTYTATLFNGWYSSQNEPLTILKNGAVIGSLKAAKRAYPDIFKKHYAQYALIEKNGFDALNSAFAIDGIFVYIPDNVIMEKPVQIISVIKTSVDSFIQPRNLVVVGKNSQLQLIHCDDTLSQHYSFINALTEVYVEENARIEHYKMQHNHNNSTLIASTYFKIKDNANVNSNTISLNGGLIRNNLNVGLDGSNCEAHLYGIYLVDGTQHVDNTTFVEHVKPSSTSHELFKGIIDEQGKAVFNGKILVHKDAQKTIAYQTNKNILLTDEATINTKPNLEIYADDVKCSHGATVGQLDQHALFYMRSRGMSEENAKMLLMYAFADEVITKINIEALREKVCQLVSKRLKGELSVCDQCVLHCGSHDAPVFNIDISKI